jgi:ABC-type nitrate/sulfonate/bicarbonate transport system substrate-binding protein
MTHKTRICFLLTAFLMLSGCGRLSHKPFRIAFKSWPGFTSFAIAEQQGFFKNRGLDVKTRVIENLEPRNQALRDGDLEAVGNSIDDAIRASALGAKGKIVLVFDRYKGGEDMAPADTLYVADSVDKSRPDDVQALVDALIEANEWWIAHKPEGNKMASEQWKLPLDNVYNMLATMDIYGTQQETQAFGSDGQGPLAKQVQKAASLWQTVGVIKTPVSADDVVDAQFVRKHH